MLYNFGSNSVEDLMSSVDSKDTLEKLKLKYSMSYDELEKNIRKYIKTPKIFNSHLDEFNLSKEEYINILVKLFPSVWNYHTIKYVKLNYLCKEM